MTVPRQLLRGTTYLITRRCLHRQLLLRPSRATTEAFRYVLAVAAERFGIEVHVACVLSNHYHLVITDPGAQLPRFEALLDALVARSVNAQLGRRETFWGPPSYNAVVLATPMDVVDKAAYVLANPVAAGLVRAGRLWPGLWSAPASAGAGGEAVRRPGHFFAKDGGLPESVVLAFTVPPGFASAEAFRAALAEALAEREAEAVRRMAGREFLGVSKVLTQQPTARPTKVEPLRRLRPRVAARDPSARVALLERLAAFVASYRDALDAWKDGARAVVFPEGTYLMRVAHGVVCSGAG